MSQPDAFILKLTGIGKTYSQQVLSDVSLEIKGGEVSALTGENGAGKSTLSRIIAGLAEPNLGSMSQNGRPYAPRSRADAEKLGIKMVMQELSLIGNLSIAENLLLGTWPTRLGFVHRQELYAEAAKLLLRVGLTLDPSQAVGELGIGHQQMVEIARALRGEAKLIIFDEPTAMLAHAETEQLFTQIARLKAEGVAIIYISHRLDEIDRLADQVGVLRDGILSAWKPKVGFDRAAIVRAMVGRDVAQADRPQRVTGSQIRLKAKGLSRGTRVQNIDLVVHAGEIVGIGGLVGSGRTDVMRLLFGADQKTSGDIWIDGEARPTTFSAPKAAMRRGLGFITEDRKSQGLLLTQPIKDNVSLGNYAKVSTLGWLRSQAETALAKGWIERLGIRSQSPSQSVGELSGGNQQKVLFARWFEKGCSLLLLDEPTRGVDIGAREDIYQELETFVGQGGAVLLVSSDIQELMMICDRIGVMREGQMQAWFDRGAWSEEKLVAAAFGETKESAMTGEDRDR